MMSPKGPLARPNAWASLMAVLTGLCLVGGPVYANGLTPQQRAQGLTTEDLAQKPKGSVGLNPMSALHTATNSSGGARRWRYNGFASYGFSQDTAQPRSPLLSTHRILLGGTATWLDRPAFIGLDDDLADELVSINFVVSGQYQTLGNEVVQNPQGKTLTLADFDLSASHSFELPNLSGARSTLDLTLGTSLPASETSQLEGVQAVPYANLDWVLSFRGGRYSLNQGLSADSVINSNTHSPSTHEINNDTSFGYSAAMSARLGLGFRFVVGGTARLVHHLDDTITQALGNFQIISWTRGIATVSLRHSNGSRAEDHNSSFWFVDEYRNVLSLSMSVRF